MYNSNPLRRKICNKDNEIQAKLVSQTTLNQACCKIFFVYMWTTCFLAYSADHAMWASEVLSEYFCNLSSHRFTQTWTTHVGSEIRLSMLMKRRFRTSLSFVRTFYNHIQTNERNGQSCRYVKINLLAFIKMFLRNCILILKMLPMQG